MISKRKSVIDRAIVGSCFRTHPGEERVNERSSLPMFVILLQTEFLMEAVFKDKPCM